MDNVTKVAVAAAVAGGYVLGRAKKGRLAFAAATYIAGRRFRLDPQQLATEGLRKLGEVPQVAELNQQIRGELLEAGKRAVVAAVNRRVGELADSLRDRTLNIGKPKPEDQEPEDEEEGQEPEDEEEEEDEEETRKERAPRRRSTTRGERPGGRASRVAPKAPAKKGRRTEGARSREEDHCHEDGGQEDPIGHALLALDPQEVGHGHQ
ncbi:hypothetical protein ACFC1R_33900 [Kitasatospora sp. NPDC056138]|uniref:hypothetical protein n=1 Tax=Kitasatospora sp. NPDC056138 TaxID=3345724 RepID=UPI0035DC3699